MNIIFVVTHRVCNLPSSFPFGFSSDHTIGAVFRAVSLASFPSTLTAATATPVVSVVVRNGVSYYVAQVCQCNAPLPLRMRVGSRMGSVTKGRFADGKSQMGSVTEGAHGWVLAKRVHRCVHSQRGSRNDEEGGESAARPNQDSNMFIIPFYHIDQKLLEYQR